MNRTTIILLTVVLSILCAYFLSFTFVARNIQQKAREFATDKKTGVLNQAKKQAYLDSLWISNKPVYNFLGFDFTYKDIKNKELALGLDLQGGMHVTMEVSPVEILKVLSGNSSDPDFLNALKVAQEKQAASQRSFNDLFYKAFVQKAPKGKLARIFTNTATKGKITYTSSDAEVKKVLDTEINDAIDRAFQILRTRIDKFGVTNPNITKLPGTGRILIELPGVDNPQRVRKLLSGVAKLEFWEVWETQELMAGWQQFNAYIAKLDEKEGKKSSKTDKGKDTDLLAKTDSSKNENPLLAKQDTSNQTVVQAKDSLEKDNQLLTKKDSVKKDSVQLAAKKDTTKKDTAETNLAKQLLVPSYEGFTVKLVDTARVNSLLEKEEVKSMFPFNTKFLYDVKADEKTQSINLYVLKKGRGGKAPLEGDVIIDARQDFDGGKPDVNMQMNTTGAKIWKKMTAANVGKKIAIVLDDLVYSAPRVNGEIPNGSSQISGSFTVEEAKDLANVLKAGKLPAPTRIVEEATVGPSLGQDSINQGLFSLLGGFLLVVLFMIVYYNFSGNIANVALVFNMFFIIGILAQFGAVLTLPGLAGIVLTIGMSVDANVLIFERIREELRHGKALYMAVKLGYEKAYSSIIDGNATTFLIAFILYLLGSGGVKGFATTLMIGIVCSMFTAVFITRLIMDVLITKNTKRKISFDTPLSKNLLVGTNFTFLENRYKAYLFSASIIVLGFIMILINGGLNLGVDFKGGRSYVVKFTEPVPVNEARKSLNEIFKTGTEVKTYDANNQLKITTGYRINDESEKADKQVEALVLKGLEKFKDKKPSIISFSKVGATIADDIANTSYWAITASLLVIFIYILIRFQKWQYGLGATIALAHDVLMIFAFMGFATILGFQLELDQVFIASVLTIIGYSINDTVVVFDRIREFGGDTESSEFNIKMNNALNDTLTRTIMTATTVFIVVIVMLFFAGEVLRGFSYALTVGIIFGTYSSVFIASPIVLDLAKIRAEKSKTPVKS